MTQTQVTLVQLDNYGPWTTTPTPRREVDLQTLQSRLYADLAQLVGNREGYVFFGRFDNMVAVTNGLDSDAHAIVQESIANRYPVTASMSVATGTSPADALGRASTCLQCEGSAQDTHRREKLVGVPLSDSDRTDGDVQIAHFDVDDVTGTYTDRLNEFDTFIEIERAYAELMRYMRTRHESLSFFVGGDNIIAVCSGLDTSDFHDAISHVGTEINVNLKVGVGRARTAQAAGQQAKHCLEVCRKEGTRVEQHQRADSIDTQAG